MHEECINNQLIRKYVSEKRLSKIFKNTMYHVSKETGIHMAILYRYETKLPKAINIRVFKKLAAHAKMTLSSFTEKYLSDK